MTGKTTHQDQPTAAEAHLRSATASTTMELLRLIGHSHRAASIVHNAMTNAWIRYKQGFADHEDPESARLNRILRCSPLNEAHKAQIFEDTVLETIQTFLEMRNQPSLPGIDSDRDDVGP